MRQKRRKSEPLKVCDLKLLHALLVEMPSLHQASQLAEVLSQSGAGLQSRNPIIRFTFQRAEEHVFERLLLRSDEALELLDRAMTSQFGESLFDGASRKRSPTDPILAFAHRLRQDWVAHRVRARRGVDTWMAMQATFGSQWRFAQLLLAVLESHLSRFAETGALAAFTSALVPVRDQTPFTAVEVAALVAAADSLSNAA